MHSDDLQFGFKKKLGCSDAIFVLRQTVEYFNNRGSNVYIASLDASKAFDRINHFRMFCTLYDKGLPRAFIDIIVMWYSNLYAVVCWNGFNSTPFAVTSGVRQGGILSPILFNLYVNCIITSLKHLDYGCHMYNAFIGCIMYADDLLLLSASILDLQAMLNECECIGSLLSIQFNSMKSKCIAIGPNMIKLRSNMTLCGVSLQWVDKVKYLGIVIIAGSSFKTDISETRRKFFTSINVILSKCKYTNEMTNLQLVESHCLPILLYATESINLNKAQMREINSWWNAAYRKIFKYNKWESVKNLIFYLDRADFCHLVNLRRINFFKNVHMFKQDNAVLSLILKHFVEGGEFHATMSKCSTQFHWSFNQVRKTVYLAFAN